VSPISLGNSFSSFLFIVHALKKNACKTYEKALEASKRAIEINSQNVFAWINKGYAMVHSKRDEETLEAFDSN